MDSASSSMRRRRRNRTDDFFPGAGHGGYRRHVHFYPEDTAGVDLLLRAAGIVKGSAEPNRTKVGKVTKKQVEEDSQNQAGGPEYHEYRIGSANGDGHRANMGLEVGGINGIAVNEARRDFEGSKWQ